MTQTKDEYEHIIVNNFYVDPDFDVLCLQDIVPREEIRYDDA